jgi:dTDP-4-dehydrorhamnose 3,5-epimerase
VIFTQTQLPGVMLIEPERLEDARGFFARTWCVREMARQGLASRLVQCSISFNPHKGTLRGMHYQTAPHEEAKLVRCTMGAVYDVIVDLRPDSPTFEHWISTELTAKNRHMVYVPTGCAHGFLTLTDDTELFYQTSEFYAPQSAKGVRWNDARFGIQWPGKVRIISERDQNYPDFSSTQCLLT